MSKLSLHFRGPTWLKQLAVYYPDTDTGANDKRAVAVDNHHVHRHNRQHVHHPNRGHVLRDHVAVERAVGDMVTATIDGQVVHWINQYAGPVTMSSTDVGLPASSIASACPYCPIQTTISQSFDAASQSSTTSASIKSANPLPVSRGPNDSSGTWSRQAYYNAEAGDLDGFTFLNHFGGSLGEPGTADGGPA